MNTSSVLQLSSLLGLLISLYFLAIYKGLLRGSNALVPQKICRKNTCSDVLQTSFAQVFKVPNFYLGIFYYLVMGLGTIVPLPLWTWYGFLIVSWFVVVFSLYLAYALIVRLKVPCTLCFVSHILNIIIAVAYLFV